MIERIYIYSSCYYHHQIGSINLSHYFHIFPWLCAWCVCNIIFCHLLYIHSGKTGNLFSYKLYMKTLFGPLLWWLFSLPMVSSGGFFCEDLEDNLLPYNWNASYLAVIDSIIINGTNIVHMKVLKSTLAANITKCKYYFDRKLKAWFLCQNIKSGVKHPSLILSIWLYKPTYI